VNDTVFSPDGRRLLVLGEQVYVWVWDVGTPDDRPAEDLVLLAQLVTGYQLDETGTLTPADPAQRRQAWQALRAKYPAAIAPPSPEAVRDWHRYRAAACAARKQGFAYQWHLERLKAAEAK
jgi:hypothetical protein